MIFYQALIIDNNLQEVPLYETNVSGNKWLPVRNWMAIITERKTDHTNISDLMTPTHDIRFERQFVNKSQRRELGLYETAQLAVGQAIEFGVDNSPGTGKYKSGSSHWYGVITKITDKVLTLNQTQSALEAITQGKVITEDEARKIVLNEFPEKANFNDQIAECTDEIKKLLVVKCNTEHRLDVLHQKRSTLFKERDKFDLQSGIEKTMRSESMLLQETITGREQPQTPYISPLQQLISSYKNS